MRLKVKLPPLNFLAVLHDGLMGAASFALALYLRLSEQTLAHTHAYLIEGCALFAFLLLVCMLRARAYRHLWRYTALTDLVTIARTATMALLLFYLLFFVTALKHLQFIVFRKR